MHFSPLDTLVTVLWNEFAAEVPEGSARSVALQLLPECRKVFAGYTLSDDFMFSPEFGQLYDELTRYGCNLVGREWLIIKRRISGTI